MNKLLEEILLQKKPTDSGLELLEQKDNKIPNSTSSIC